MLREQAWGSMGVEGASIWGEYGKHVGGEAGGSAFINHQPLDSKLAAFGQKEKG